MAHNLNVIGGRASMFYTGKRPWHELGTVLAHPATAREAIEAARLGYTVETAPIYLQDGTEIDDYRATVRQDTKTALGVVGDRYVPVQNTEAFGFFDAVVGAGQAIYHTAGALGRGERVWMLAQIPGDLRVHGTEDLIERFLLLTNSHDGSSCLRMFFTPVRVVCQNTLNVALRGGKQQGISIRHTGNIQGKVEEAQRALGLAVKYYDDLGAILDRLVEIPMSRQGVAEYFKTLVPDNVTADQATRTQNIRDRMSTLFERGRGNHAPKIRGTLWAALNAVTEYVDHDRSTRGKTEADRASNRLESIWWGSGADLKARAWTEALAVAGIKD